MLLVQGQIYNYARSIFKQYNLSSLTYFLVETLSLIYVITSLASAECPVFFLARKFLLSVRKRRQGWPHEFFELR